MEVINLLLSYWKNSTGFPCSLTVDNSSGNFINQNDTKKRSITFFFIKGKILFRFLYISEKRYQYRSFTKVKWHKSSLWRAWHAYIPYSFFPFIWVFFSKMSFFIQRTTNQRDNVFHWYLIYCNRTERWIF